MIAPYYQDVDVTIYHADCFEVLHELENIDAIATDPPYSSGGAFRGDRMGSTLQKYVRSESSQQETGFNFTGDNRDQRSFMAWSTLWLNACRRASKPGATLSVFIDWRQLPTMTDAVQGGGWLWRGIGAWSKKFGRPRNGGFSSACEFLVWASNGELIASDKYPAGVFECSSPPVADRDHITEKPEAVVAWAMGNIVTGSIVLDPFMGSGTTLSCARSQGLRSIGIEIDERNCELAAKSLAQARLPL